MTRVIAILTMGRSGSSALAGALHQADIPFETQSDNMGSSSAFNPKGHFEMRSWWQAGKHIKDNMDDPGNGARRRMVAAYAAVIDRRCQEAPEIWGVKSPFSIWTMPIWRPLLPADHRVIILRRERDAVVQSVMRHHNCGAGVSHAEAAEVVNGYIAAMERTVKTLDCPRMEVRYEDVLADPYRTIAPVLDFCFDGIRPVEEWQLNNAAQWIDPDLSHYALPVNGNGRA